MHLLATCLISGIAAAESPVDIRVSLWSQSDREIIVVVNDFAIITESATSSNVFVGERSANARDPNVEVILSPDRRYLILRALEEAELTEAFFFTCDPE